MKTQFCWLAIAALAVPLSFASPAMARPVVEVAFVLDTTGSMSGLIESAKRKIWAIATAIVDDCPDADIRMGLVAYRDIGDDYVVRSVDLTTDSASFRIVEDLKACDGTSCTNVAQGDARSNTAINASTTGGTLNTGSRRAFCEFCCSIKSIIRR